MIEDKIKMLKKVDIFQDDYTNEDREKYYDVMMENDNNSTIKKEWINDISMALYDNKKTRDDLTTKIMKNSKIMD